MNKERLKEIFVEEATEIIEKLDVEILDLEDRSDDKDLLNELFRGVHTLKGSANSFGFRRLGEFVHAFEDVLDYYRSSSDSPGREEIDLFLDGVDVIKEVFEYEVNEKEGKPEKYMHCIEGFKLLSNKESPRAETQKVQATPAPTSDLSSEFGEDCAPQTIDGGEYAHLFAALPDGAMLYKIVLKLDEDLYLRGQDHSTYFRLLNAEGRIIESKWDMSAIPSLQELETEKHFIKSVEIFLESEKSLDDIKEIFEYLEDEEYSVELLAQEEKVVAAAQDDALAEGEKIEAINEQIEENNTVSASQDVKKSSASQEASESKEGEPKKMEKRSFVKIDTLKLDELFDSVGELVIAQNFLGENAAIKTLKSDSVNKTIETLSKITKLIQGRVMSLRMVQIKDTFEKMRRVTRDASKKVKKEVRLVISGEDTEIDKTMVDALQDPLLHIIRNAIDHGLEATAEDRIKAGKPEEGTVYLKAYHKGGNIVIEISDDGRGINKEKVLQKAKERGLVGENEELSDAQIYGLIMQPGFSTADKISDISGRGVGLDVVRTSIEELRGKIEIDSTPGKGSKFAILLPLTLAIIDGMLVKSGGEVYIIPTLSIVESFRPTKDIVHTAQGKGEFVNLRSELLPVIRLNRLLELDTQKPNIWESTLVCAENERGRFAILVDDLIGRQQVVIKTLGKTLSHLKEISGGAVLGNGEIALILNVDGLF